jgi:hypothetical protein
LRAGRRGDDHYAYVRRGVAKCVEDIEQHGGRPVQLEGSPAAVTIDGKFFFSRNSKKYRAFFLSSENIQKYRAFFLSSDNNQKNRVFLSSDIGQEYRGFFFL